MFRKSGGKKESRLRVIIFLRNIWGKPTRCQSRPPPPPPPQKEPPARLGRKVLMGRKGTLVLEGLRALRAPQAPTVLRILKALVQKKALQAKQERGAQPEHKG